jgi:putative ATP-dependent endonuclease of OLD family
VKLRHLQIKNFRGITDLELELGNTTVLIGENNTGKTAVLDALRFALRDIRSRRGCAFDSYDFHLPNATSEPATAAAISIRLTFREETPGEWDDQQTARLNRAKIAQADANGCTSVILKVGARFDPVAQDFVQDWEFQNLTGAAFSNVPDTALLTLQNEVSYYYLAALRDAAKHFDAKGAFWRPFLKESQLTAEKRTEIEAKLADVNQLIISSHGSFAQVVDRLKEVQQVLSIPGGDDLVSVDAVPGRLFDMLAKAQVNLNTGTGAKIPVGRHGEGTQSLAVLTLFNAFLQVWNRGAPIVALEEPESHLHPNAVRALWKLIERIPGQKIISTHSGDLVSEVPSESVIRLYLQSGRTVPKRMKDIPLDDKKRRQFNYHIRHARGELLFARCWILVEGETEVTLLPELARILGKDLERNGIRCIAYRQSDIALFIQVAESMGIHWIAITDNDSQQGKSDQEKVRKSLGARPENDVLFVMPEDNIEQHLCASGFTHVYESFLSKQSQANIKVVKTDPTYIKQLTKNVGDHKIAAIYAVLTEIRDGANVVPPLFALAIDAAIQWAN